MTDIEDRFTRRRVSRERLKLEAKRSAKPSLVVVAGMLVAVAATAFIVMNVSRISLTKSYTVKFAVDDATAVVGGGVDEVRYRGIPAGKIQSVEMVDGQPVVTAKIQAKYGKIYRDARAELRPNTALLDMYLNITDRGTAAAGQAQNGPPIAAGNTRTGVKVSDVLQVFHGDTRVRLRTLLDQLGNGLDGRGLRLRQAFVELVPLLQSAAQLTDQISTRAPQTKRLVHNVGVLTKELGLRDTQLRTLLGEGSATLQTLQANQGALDATLRQLPGTVSAVQTSFAAVHGVIGDVDQAVDDLQPVAKKLPDSLATVRRLTTTAGPAVRALRTPVQKLVPLSDALVPLSRDLDTAVSRLRPQTGTINHVVKTADGCHTGINGFFQWDASMAKYGDVRGPSPRGNVVASVGSTGILNDPWEYNPDACVPGRPIAGRPARPEDGK
ncbi:hypothetical protein DSM112329_00345 [Paraconexibacter sp. AEG42_29]|uniref:Mce/MlaD domain-containing protein n=1 Tax=Paraconexibacter sp. AEG42_29 TaxID=2997339 RepID=A0AAU7APF8_9ACTN